MSGKISLHSIENGKRLTQSAEPSELKFKTYMEDALPPHPKGWGFCAGNTMKEEESYDL